MLPQALATPVAEYHHLNFCVCVHKTLPFGLVVWIKLYPQTQTQTF